MLFCALAIFRIQYGGVLRRSDIVHRWRKALGELSSGLLAVRSGRGPGRGARGKWGGMKMVAPLEVGICCRDIEALSRFYVDELGCVPIVVNEVGAERARTAHLSRDAYRVARLQTPWGERIKLLQSTTTPRSAEEVEWILDRQGATYLTFIVEDLEALVSRLQASRVQFVTGNEPVEIRPGVWLAFARDPEGNVLEFVEYEVLADYREDIAPATTRVR